MQAATPTPAVLFTAFEPSGDDLASAVIRRLRARRPDMPLYAWGGPKMAAAGADVIERTGEDAVVGFPGVGKVFEHIAVNRRIARWMDEHPVTLHVPVDSPAANFSICRIARRRGVRIVHLAAPQMWAWAPWRVRKLRRLTDRVLCLLPFEEAWFRDRGVPATFISHPLFDTRAQPAASHAGFPAGSPRLAVMPGSRPKELERHLPLYLETIAALRDRHPELAVLFAVKDDAAVARVRRTSERLGQWPAGAEVTSAGVAAAAEWADVCLTKSGTVTLHITRLRRPMVVVYRANALAYRLIGRWLITIPDRAMPNLIAGRRIVPEFIPHLGGAGPIIEAVGGLLDNPAAQRAQRTALDEVASRFEGRNAAETAAAMIERYATVEEEPRIDAAAAITERV